MKRNRIAGKLFLLIVFFTVLIFSLFSCMYFSGVKKDGDSALYSLTQYLNLILEYTQSGTMDFYLINKKLIPFILPDFFLQKKMKPENCFVNIFRFDEYSIKKADFPFYTVYIKNKQEGWSHTLLFKMAVIEGNAYLIPSKIIGNTIDPWWDILE